MTFYGPAICDSTTSYSVAEAGIPGLTGNPKGRAVANFEKTLFGSSATDCEVHALDATASSTSSLATAEITAKTMHSEAKKLSVSHKNNFASSHRVSPRIQHLRDRFESPCWYSSTCGREQKI